MMFLFNVKMVCELLGKVTKKTCRYEIAGYTFKMQNTKYHIWQDDNGWRGYLDGYPAYEIHGESFEELQVKFWQLREDLLMDEGMRELEQLKHPSDSSLSEGEYCDHASSTASVSRQMSPAQLKARARVELLMLMMITSLNAT